MAFTIGFSGRTSSGYTVCSSLGSIRSSSSGSCRTPFSRYAIPAGAPADNMPSYRAEMLRKSIVAILVAALLGVLVWSTFATKQFLFGSTPVAYSFSTGIRYAMNMLVAEIGLQGGRALSFAFAAFGNEAAKASAVQPARGIPVLTYHRIVSNANDLNNVTLSH